MIIDPEEDNEFADDEEEVQFIINKQRKGKNFKINIYKKIILKNIIRYNK